MTCGAVDSSGNAASGTFDVIVKDTVAPVVTVPANIVTGATSASGAAVSFSASATDLVAGSITPTCLPASGSTFALGATTVTCTASDGSNTGSASFTVTVNDTGAPVISGTPANITVFGGPNGADGEVCPADGRSMRSRDRRPVICSPPSGSIFVIGTTTVTCTRE